MNIDAEAHFRWIGIIADRIICAKDPENQLPLLSLSFLGENKNIPNFSKFKRPIFPITVENLADGKLYAIILYALSANKKTHSNPNLAKVYDILNENLTKKNDIAIKETEINSDFESILTTLSNRGYRPRKPCDPSGLNDQDIENHVNLCKCIELAIVDRSLRIDLLISDLRRLPRSFFTFQPNTHFDQLEDAVSLWLSKFHCNPFFTKEAKIGSSKYENENQKLIKQYKLQLNHKDYSLQIDTSKYSKVAACLARVFPKQINKNDIKDGIDEEEIQFNKNLSNIVLNELHAFVIEEFPCDERLFLLFISDLFYATRECTRELIKFQISHQPTFIPRHQPLQIHNYQIARPKAISVFAYTRKPIINDIKNNNNTIQNLPASRIDFFKPNINAQSKIQPKIVKPTVESTPLPPLKSAKQLTKEKSHVIKSHKKHNKKHKANQANEEPIKEDQNTEEEDQNSNEQTNLNIEQIPNQEEENKKVEIEKKAIPKYGVEYPEIEILLKRLIDKYPDDNNYFIDLYDIFMRTIQEASTQKSPKVTDIFKRTQSTFQLLLEGQKIDYDFEFMLSNMIKKKS